MAEFMPATLREVRDMGWDGLDVVLVTGDAYIDSPHSGVAVIGRVLMDAGYRVGVVAQPDVGSDKDIQRLGEPELFWGVTSGNVDSMVANYTASGKRRKSDDMTPGGKNERRPDRAVIVYANLIRRYFKNTRPIVLGGVEASLRRVSQYDAWSDSVRRSVLFDAKADYIVYGMGEQAVVELAQALREKRGVEHIRGICYVSGDVPEPDAAFADPAVRLPDHAAVAKSMKQFGEMFKTFCQNADPATGKRLCQLQDTRFLVQNPPPLPPTSRQLDEIYELPFSRKLHPLDEKDGAVKALDTVRFSLTTHRGCFGDCRFCAIAVHQGRRVVSRTKESILREARSFLSHPDFKGIVSDAGGPTANMYGMECERKKKKGACKDKGCLFPAVCKGLRLDHGPQIELLKAPARDRGNPEGVCRLGNPLRPDRGRPRKRRGIPGKPSSSSRVRPDENRARTCRRQRAAPHGQARPKDPRRIPRHVRADEKKDRGQCLSDLLPDGGAPGMRPFPHERPPNLRLPHPPAAARASPNLHPHAFHLVLAHVLLGNGPVFRGKNICGEKGGGQTKTKGRAWQEIALGQERKEGIFSGSKRCENKKKTAEMPRGQEQGQMIEMRQD